MQMPMRAQPPPRRDVVRERDFVVGAAGRERESPRRERFLRKRLGSFLEPVAATIEFEEVAMMHKAVKEMMEIFLREGSTNAVADRLTPFDEFNKFIGLPEMAAREKRFSS